MIAAVCGLLWIGLSGLGSADERGELFRTDVFVSRQDGYHTYRIPALALTNSGTLLAFCEGRKSSDRDEGDIDLLLKRSVDDGRTWSQQIIVHEDGGDANITVGNPCPIIERNSNRIHLLFTRNNKRLFYVRSTDDGVSWSAPKEFTQMLKGFDYPRVRIATGPVHGIQLRNGRLVAPVWVSDRERKDRNVNPTFGSFRSGSIYSDDEGETWKTGQLVPPKLNRLSENTVVEKKDGSLLLNARGGQVGFRAISTSIDGGETWSEPFLDKNLPCPTCQGSMIRFSENEILFLNPAGDKREKLTLRLSSNDGKDWSHTRVLNKGSAAYSDMAVSKDGRIFCLFENGEIWRYERISIMEVTRDWLTAGK